MTPVFLPKEEEIHSGTFWLYCSPGTAWNTPGEGQRTGVLVENTAAYSKNSCNNGETSEALTISK